MWVSHNRYETEEGVRLPAGWQLSVTQELQSPHIKYGKGVSLKNEYYHTYNAHDNLTPKQTQPQDVCHYTAEWKMATNNPFSR